MNELPKIALAWLRAKADVPKPAGASAGPPGFGESAHPDANMIAAFAEKTLTDRERTQVLNHLSQCADCREVAAFIVPADAVVEESAHINAGMRWNPWPMLRWGALAGVLGILAIVVVSHPDMWRHNQQIAKVTPPPFPAGNVEKAPTAVAPLPSTPPPAKDAEADKRLKTRGSASENAQAKKESGPERYLAKTDRLNALQAQQHTTMMASVRPPAELNAPAVGMSRRESLGDEARAVAAPPVQLVPAAPAGEPQAVSGEAGKANAESSRSAAPHNVTQSVTVTAEAESVSVISPSATATGSAPGAAARQTTAAKTAPRAATQASAQGMARSSKFGIGGFSKESKLKASQPIDLWSVSSDGKVQHSVDGAKTFQSIEVAPGVKFQAVAANGNDIWAGGAGGALHHSIDAGATWVRGAINFEGTTMTETISAIQLHGTQHLTVITASGSAWVSEDGGLHWQKQP